MGVETLIRVLIVDDHAMFRNCVCKVLQSYPNIAVVGEAGDGDQAVVEAGKLRPAVVLMDISMMRMDGVTATRLIKTQYPEIAVLGVSVDPKSFYVDAMLKAGASQVLSKEEVLKELYVAIEKAVPADQPIFTPEDASQST